jgi:hypothetical protein
MNGISVKFGESGIGRTAVALLAGCLLLAGCATPGGGGKVDREFERALDKPVTLVSPYLSSYPGAPKDKLAVQYAVVAVLNQAGIGYDWGASATNIGATARRFVRPNITNATCREALSSILTPLSLTYTISDGKLVLMPIPKT